jgi:restriction endonuclease S subunit
MKRLSNVTVPIGELKKIKIPLPDIKEQEKFETIMKKLDELENNIGNNEKNADLLMQAILQETFSS